MHAIEHTYVSLLADVARLSGFSEIRGSYDGLQWCLNEAPKLEKLMLEHIELGIKPELEKYPAWLRRLVAGSFEDPVLLRYLRQLLLFCYKASVTHDKTTTEKAFRCFIETNRDVGAFGNRFSTESPKLLNIARRHCQSVLYRFREGSLSPSHGPGAVTTDKDRWKHLYSTIEYLYAYSDWYSPYFNMDAAKHWENLEHRDTIQAKLIAVPKDSRGPRLICVHPAEAIWLQQGLRRELERAITLRRYASGPWPSGRIQFDSQESNGSIALSSSRTRLYATLDMKEASDRISEPLVQVLFGDKYKWFGCCRAQEYIIPAAGGLANIRGQINCYAPMGNATTFPVQSLVFWSICVAALQSRGFHQPGAVFVFGDDIIVPTECAEYVIDALESFGLLVNRTKSFYRGGFRESCGVDAFKGVDVTPVRWKTTLDAEHDIGMQSLSDLAMRLRIAGYEESAVTAYALLQERLWSRCGWMLPLTSNTDHGGIAEFSTLEASVWRDAYWHRDYQRFVSPVVRLETSEHRLRSCDWNHVLESLCSLERSGRSSIPVRNVSRRTRLNRGWISIR